MSQLLLMRPACCVAECLPADILRFTCEAKLLEKLVNTLMEPLNSRSERNGYLLSCLENTEDFCSHVVWFAANSASLE